jgi:hypothetical protein
LDGTSMEGIRRATELGTRMIGMMMLMMGWRELWRYGRKTGGDDIFVLNGRKSEIVTIGSSLCSSH